jgi:hypothetical protein
MQRRDHFLVDGVRLAHRKAPHNKNGVRKKNPMLLSGYVMNVYSHSRLYQEGSRGFLHVRLLLLGEGRMIPAKKKS